MPTYHRFDSVAVRARLAARGTLLGLSLLIGLSATGCLPGPDAAPPRVVNPPPSPPSTAPRPGIVPLDAGEPDAPTQAPPDAPPRPECVEGSLVSTELCAAGLACSEGKCVPCVAGESCTPEDPCHKGTRECGPAIKCVDTGTPVEAGKSCGMNLVCTAAGKCEACTAGETCKPTDLCKAGKIECTSGAPVCVPSADAPNGSSCGEGQVCSAGACAPCRDGMTCVPTNKCHTGTLSCSTGTPQCMDTGMNAMNGTSCGEAQVCRGGECVGCVEKMPCTPTDSPCKVGEIRCASGTPVCMATAMNAADGKECGAELACRGGMCRQCRTTGSCSNNPCKDSTYQCMNGVESCRETNKANGTICPGGENACLDGRCQQCRTSGECDDQPCKSSSFRCNGGRESCQSTGNVRDGTRACGAEQACRGGSCQRCRTRGSCEPDDSNDARCRVGSLTCDGNGVEQCAATTQLRNPGDGCGGSGGRVCARTPNSSTQLTCQAPLANGTLSSCDANGGRTGRRTKECRSNYCDQDGVCNNCGGQDQDCCPDGGNNGCGGGLACESGTCVRPRPNGAPCDEGSQCESRTCDHPPKSVCRDLRSRRCGEGPCPITPPEEGSVPGPCIEVPDTDAPRECR